MGDIKEGMDETEVNIKDLNSLTDSLVEVKEETARYSQLGTAQENLNKLINVPEIVKDTENAIFEYLNFCSEAMISLNPFTKSSAPDKRLKHKWSYLN